MKQDSFNIKFIVLSKRIWMVLFVFLLLINFFSLIGTIYAYQEPITTTKSEKILSYTGNSEFNYLTNLYQNTVYNKTVLNPGEGVIFKQIVKNITGYHHFKFTINKTASLSLSYSIIAIIQTDLWTKSYTLVPSLSKNSTGYMLEVAEKFPIDYNFYDDILIIINEETGINAPNPILIIRAMATISAKTTNYSIYETYSPEITMSLNQKTIEFSEFLTTQQSGSKSKSVSIDKLDAINLQTTWSYISVLLIIILIMFLIFSSISPSNTSELEKAIMRIEKKYGEWMVRAENDPVDEHAKIISISSIEHLSRISEDLGKPIIHYQKNPLHNIFSVIDDDYIYQHFLQIKKTKNKRFFPFNKKSS